MKTKDHQIHLDSNISHSDCCECRADTERRFATTTKFNYDHIHAYLNYIRPCLDAIRNGDNSVNARIWHIRFMRALHRRITSRQFVPVTRKRSDAYLERLDGARWNGHKFDVGYMQWMAQRGASCLDR